MRTRILAGVVGTLLLALALAAPQFATTANLVVMIDNMALETIMLAAITLLLIGGLFDLSLDGVVALSGVVAGRLFMAGASIPVAVAGALGVGLAVGSINGFLVSRWRLNPFMVTLGTWWTATGMTYGMTMGMSPHGFPDLFQAFGQARFMGLRLFVFYGLAVVAVASVILSRTVLGRHIYAMGGSRRAAELCGVNVTRLGMGLYVQAGLLASFLGLILAARLNSGAPNAVDGMTLRAIAAAVIGGCSLAGGRGSIMAGLLGLVLMAVLSNASILLHVSPYWQKALIGLVLLVAIASECIGRKSNNGSV